MTTAYQSRMERLVEAGMELSQARDLDGIITTVRSVARELTGADGATFVLRDGDLCYYVDEDAIAPLWKGRHFPMDVCISGWCMRNRQPITIEDIYQDDRIPADAYRPTFVKSLAMVPIRTSDPVGAIGNYWAVNRQPTEEEVRLLQALADLTSVSMENVRRSAETLEAIRARDEFLSIASHELRTPLTPIRIQMSHLRELAYEIVDRDKERAVRTGLALIDRQTRRLERLIDELLDVSRIMGDRLQLQLEELELVEAIERVVAEVRQRSSEASAAVIQIEADEPIVGRWDRLRVEQVIDNLVSNAIKYGQGQPIHIRVERAGDDAVIEVQDGGIGVPPEDHDRVFGRFERAVSVRNYGGLGVGLFIARQFIERMGGSIALRSEPGQGATFTVALPIRGPG
jgi:signal transduction histidine kinase